MLQEKKEWSNFPDRTKRYLSYLLKSIRFNKLASFKIHVRNTYKEIQQLRWREMRQELYTYCIGIYEYIQIARLIM